ncbi:hypothetical protein SASPL_138490 [Salvia splendens]|uniref:Hexosyltransferase n=1 Tax=Salvia splendens TaxID=180675 RepID=A0A8X8WX66_SALSN|nr:hypothetical protein SASPL_138490 [Salvia splendens]
MFTIRKLNKPHILINGGVEALKAEALHLSRYYFLGNTHHIQHPIPNPAAPRCPECRKPPHTSHKPQLVRVRCTRAGTRGHQRCIGQHGPNGLYRQDPHQREDCQCGFRPCGGGSAVLQWSHLYPEWIDETNAKCPNVPMPVFENYEQLDVVVARVPSDEFGLKDVFRLQVNLVVANLLVRCGRAQSGISSRSIFAVFIGASGPMSEIFRCDDLVLHDADSWIHRPELKRIREIVLMPVGSCQLNPPLPYVGKELWSERDDGRLKQPREAYATIVHSTETYVCGAIALARSIIKLNTTKDLILLADYHISPKSISGLQSAGWKIKQIKRIRNPHSKKRSYNEWNYSKLRLWQLTDYDKIIFIDSDFIVTKSLDHLFRYPGISARGNNQDRFNSGLMLLEPSLCVEAENCGNELKREEGVEA